jgi:hypothetical protein
LYQNEWSVCLLQEYSDPDQVSLGPDLLDLEEDDSNCRHGDGHDDPVHQQNEVSTTAQHYTTVQAYYSVTFASQAFLKAVGEISFLCISV